jgi:replicative DNA helicase
VTTASEHARTLLSAIIPDRHDLLERAVRDLTPQQIPDRVLSNLLTLLERYSEITGAVLTRDALADLLAASRADAATLAAYQETYDELHDLKADEAAFRWALQQIRELAADRATTLALTEGMEILTRGVTTEQGEQLRGHADARLHILTRFADLDRDLSMQQAPEGDMRGEGRDILAEYMAQEQAHKQGRGGGVLFGVPPLDDKVGGLHRGALVLVVGYTSDGKTSLCVQLAWSAVVEQGKNVLFLTTETIRNQVRRRVIARHSCLSVFGSEGLNSRDIKDGTLMASDRERFAEVVSDFDDNPAYGRLYIAQVPRGASMGYIESKAVRVGRQMHIDLVVMDYLALLKPERKRNTDREELSGILKAAKQMSTTLNDGEGVPFVSPWQVSRTARAEAEKLGYYTLNALSETAETSNSADDIISLLAPLDNQDRRAKVRAQLMKHRDGAKANSIELLVDYATSRFSGHMQAGTDLDNVFDPLGNSPYGVFL